MDVLRGVAVLGILVMNIQSFAMIRAAYINPTAYGDLTGANLWVWGLSHVFADQKFITIFSMLFGAGILLNAGKAEFSGKLHSRRMASLILFGLAHAYLLWYGDILATYGVCGLLAYLFREKPAGTLFIWAFALWSIASVLSVSSGWSIRSWPEEAIQGMQQDWAPQPQRIQAELEAYRGGWREQMSFRAPSAFFFQTGLFALVLGWKVSGLMLFGMALFQFGVFSAQRSTRFYRGLVFLGALIGIPIVCFGMHQNFSMAWDVRYSYFFGGQFNYCGSVLVALGWIGAVMLVCKAERLRVVTHRLAAVGRTAFSNYVLQTVLCTTIFYGHGFGLFGKVDRVGQMAVVAAVWTLQLIISPLWLRYFSFGPLEWLWRRLTYGKMPAWH